jgi:hypothetical protein
VTVFSIVTDAWLFKIVRGFGFKGGFFAWRIARCAIAPSASPRNGPLVLKLYPSFLVRGGIGAVSPIGFTAAPSLELWGVLLVLIGFVSDD